MVDRSPTAASAWGDLNGDGWPDLWVSNHHGLPPTLYLNRRDGTFESIAGSRIAESLLGGTRTEGQGAAIEAPDFHGAGWADFDADGDQDLLVVTGAGAGRGKSANHLFVNDGGWLRNAPGAGGLDYPLGRGRTPLWFDANGDGRLDALLMNSLRADAPSALFLQETGIFVRQNHALNADEPRSEAEGAVNSFWRMLESWASELMGAGSGSVTVSDEFAQLTDVDGDADLELMVYGTPTRTYRTRMLEGRLEALAEPVPVPDVSAVQDARFADVDGDGRLDWFLVRSRPWASDVTRIDGQNLAGKITTNIAKPTGISFESSGTVTIRLYRPWMDASDPERDRSPPVYLGSHRILLSASPLILDPADPSLAQAPPADTAGEAHIAIRYDPVARTWSLTSSLSELGFTIRADQALDRVEPHGFTPSGDALPDVLLLNREDGFVNALDSIPREPTPCVSAAAADFDNDMDVDFYLVCTHPAGNAPNRLYINDGNGAFSKVEDAAGAGGSGRGRGNQVSAADFDRDGFVDLFVTNGSGPPPFADGPHQLFRNMGNDNHWIEIDLRGTRSNRDGIGATVYLDAGGRRQVRLQDGGIHAFSQDHSRLHFGLGTNGQADAITIHWPDGRVQRVRDVRANQIIEIVEE